MSDPFGICVFGVLSLIPTEFNGPKRMSGAFVHVATLGAEIAQEFKKQASVIRQPRETYRGAVIQKVVTVQNLRAEFKPFIPVKTLVRVILSFSEKFEDALPICI